MTHPRRMALARTGLLSLSIAAWRVAAASALAGQGPPAACPPAPVAAATGAASPTYLACQVDLPARPPLDRPIAAYAALMAESNVEGFVVLRFTVDTLGAVDSMAVVVRASTHEIFTRAARATLSAWRFEPALLRGAHVRQVTEVGFCFRLLDGGTRPGDRCEKELAQVPPTAISFSCEEATGRMFYTEGGGTRTIVPPRRPGSRCP